MQNRIETIWHHPEKQSWENLYYNLVSRKVYRAAEGAARAARSAAVARSAAAGAQEQPAAQAAAKSKIVLEHIFNWNITWWQNQ